MLPEMPDDAPPAPASPEAPAPPDEKHAPETARRLHPLTLFQQGILSIPGLLVIAIPLFLGGGSGNTWFSLFALVVYGVVAVPLLVLRYLRFRYWITAREIVIRSGVLNRQDRSIPLERVQNVQIEQPLLPRLMGTARVKIETAGSSNTEGVLEYVALEEAQRLRRVVRTYQRRRKPDAADALTSDAPDEATADAEVELLFAMPLRRVLLSGAFRFSLLYVALVLSVLQYVPDFEDSVVRWIEQGRWQWMADAAAASPWLAVALTGLVAALFAWLTGVLINLNRYYGFRLSLEDGKLQRRHGLLTLSQGTIPLDRVQALILRTNPLMRAFGFYRLELQTMGLDVKEQGHQVAVPFAERAEVLRLARAIRPLDFPEHFDPVSRLTIRRAFVRYAVALGLVVAPLAHFVWSPLWWGLAALPLLGGLAVLRYRNMGYRLSTRHLYVRSGVFQHFVWVLPVEKHQVFYTRASFFQRRLGLASLYADTAGASTFSYPQVTDLPADKAHRGLAVLYALFQQRMHARAEPPPDSPAPDEPMTDEPPVPDGRLGDGARP